MGPSDLFAAAGGTGALTKLTIVAFEKPDQDGQADNITKYATRTVDDPDVFIAYYNPSSFSSTFGITYAAEQSKGSITKEMIFKEMVATTYSFDLLLDGTGASKPQGRGDKDQTVQEMIDQFLKVAYTFRGTIHRPPYLRLEWGTTTVHKCVLTSATVKHDLFDAAGTSMRATITCAFTGYAPLDLEKAKKNEESPDMTHTRIVQQGDRLPMMCEKIYGDAKLYLQVARFNGLINYRDIKPGTKIYFPPLLTSKT